MRRLFLFSVLLLLLSRVLIIAQDNTDLITENVEIITETDAFGQPVTLVVGDVVNQSDSAYTGLDIFAEALDASGELIGEGFGTAVNACGVGLLPDFALQPGRAQPFRVTIELFEEGELDEVVLFPEGTATDPIPLDLSQVFPGIRGVVRDEVVQVEWVDDGSLRYAVGCDADVFTALDWFSYDLESGTSAPIAHPAAERVTEALLTQLDLMEPDDYNRSFLTFPPNGRRIVYQTDINTVLTAEPDGSFKRLIWDDLARRSLHGLIWLPEGRFLAYYYGAFGEPVTYFTASLEGQRISQNIYNVVPSMTIPGATPDGAFAVITTTVNEVTGYYRQSTIFNGTTELLFETEDIPGNNWPAPIYAVYENNQAFVYIMRPVEGEARLQCFDMQTRTLNDLVALPLNLTTDDRAWSWLSPNGTQIALAANGSNGGLWLIDLLAYGGCSSPEPA
ncbi:MAG: hypothetical protein OHK0046_22070 [Anaerolineae bacterium]